MLTFEKWRELHESIHHGAQTLGVQTPPSVGVAGGFPWQMDEKKKMLDPGALKGDNDGELDDPKKVPPKDVPPAADGDMDDDDLDMDGDDDGDCEMCGKNMKKHSKKHSKKGMKKESISAEDADFYDSLARQMAPPVKYDDGWDAYQEDALLADGDPNAGLADASPGEVGHAPVGRIGDIGGRQPTTAGQFEEWADIYKKSFDFDEESDDE